MIISTVLATSISLSLWGDHGKWIAMVVMAPALLLFGEIIPKSLALRHPERWARLIAPPLAAVLPLLTPFRVVLLSVSRGLMSLMGIKPKPKTPLLQEDDFIRMVEDSHKGGLIAPIEKELIVNLMSLGETTVGQVMVPKPDIFYLPLNMTLADLIKAIKQARFSRVPIYGEDFEDIVGILHAKDLLNLSPENPCEPSCLKKLLRPPYYVPENKRAFDLLGELQARKIRLALVVDEYGSLTGLVSVEDLLVELFGEFEEEFEEADRLLEQLAPGVYLVKSWMPLDELNETLGLSLPLDEFDTLGGFVFNLFGELPHEGDSINYNGLKFDSRPHEGHPDFGNAPHLGGGMIFLSYLGIFLFLLLLEGFFTCSEIALISANHRQLQHLAENGNRGAMLAQKLLRFPEKLFATTLLGSNLAETINTVLVSALLIDMYGPTG